MITVNIRRRATRDGDVFHVYHGGEKTPVIKNPTDGDVHALADSDRHNSVRLMQHGDTIHAWPASYVTHDAMLDHLEASGHVHGAPDDGYGHFHRDHRGKFHLNPDNVDKTTKRSIKDWIR